MPTGSYREDEVILESGELWAAATNTYVIAPEPGGPAVIVDAPPDVDAIVALLARHDLSAAALLLTHGHIDHVGGAGGAVRRTGAVAYLHPDDDFLAADPVAQLQSIFGVLPPGSEEFAPPDRFEQLTDGQRLTLAGMEFEVRHTPGHTPGHVCFHLEDEGMLFSGDQLFAGSIGRTDFPYGDFDALMRSMANKVMTLPDEIAVLPGHGPATTIGRERTTNPFILDHLRS
jgi:glyoxylase-like metal-dependent hydrolase (beta-lactamase superfamily II)